MNYKHLRYFYAVAKEGSIVQASRTLHVSPQTISGQLTQFEHWLGVHLFDRFGKKLILNDAGKIALSYAEDIFGLGQELKQSLQSQNFHQQLVFNVGVVDVIPKILAKQILEECLFAEISSRLVAREGDFEVLLSQLAMNKLDLILSDRPLTPGLPIQAHCQELGACGLSFYCKENTQNLTKDFPKSLHEAPFLIAGDNSAQKVLLRSWFETLGIQPLIVGEFDDTALMKFFGQAGYGVFCTPSIIETYVVDHYQVQTIGSTDTLQERFYAVTPERKLHHPGVQQVIARAKALFA